ncbi:TPA: LysR family transcriptional regulator [Providencia stuartii]|uniref:Transcriptional regulator, LysR family n=2 Tax=Providencia stuartii TaxID=588 RepID=A0AA86YEM4_PROST|nr:MULTISPECIES: LysR family transcriptional regulator [Providencia]AFH93174.1 DNA-binding transcriptional regulator OxyR [Providencia stuartii MRSN 2154]AMG68443.1 LysR family transcriptional regulator [Providencia stuartii]APG51171.1 transcriptional regulator [Providencia stuartii]AVE40929.1 LysR family transcriptional regulator [Providencia stuartii]AVL38888.1 LysR family transcriptional regulator [Providencia stuartii]
MNIRDFEYLNALGKFLNFKKAAQYCNVAQPTLSIQIGKLENTLGCFLLERTTRRVNFTPLGLQILEHSKIILKEIEEIKAIAQQSTNNNIKTFHIGISDSLPEYFASYITEAVLASDPNINLIVTVDSSEELFAQLASMSLNLLIVSSTKCPDNFISASLISFPINHQFVTQKGHSTEQPTSILGSYSEIKSKICFRNGDRNMDNYLHIGNLINESIDLLLKKNHIA